MFYILKTRRLRFADEWLQVFRSFQDEAGNCETYSSSLICQAGSVSWDSQCTKNVSSADFIEQMRDFGSSRMEILDFESYGEWYCMGGNHQSRKMGNSVGACFRTPFFSRGYVAFRVAFRFFSKSFSTCRKVFDKKFYEILPTIQFFFEGNSSYTQKK